MPAPIIEVDRLAKRYRLGAIGATSLRDSFSRSWERLRGRAPKADQQDFWALRNASFSVQRGEVVGIIGRNGAGKSTLLKLLSRITEPTSGRAVLRGRVAALLEVGTGFHPDLTGRENVFLNGAILGMTREEIRRKFDEIVAFAEVDNFIDTPVKRYSSGMYVRLAFAVAAHLEPEILIVDEVLAVGDAQFQKKCLGKMGEVSRHGRTILFVSHNMAAVRTLCSRGILLADGLVAADGTADQVVERYLSAGANSPSEVSWCEPGEAPGNERVRLKAVRVMSEGQAKAEVDIDKKCQVEVDYWNLTAGLPLCVSIHLLDRMGVEVLASVNWPSASLERDPWFGQPYPAGVYRTTCELPANFLNDGSYSVRVFILSHTTKVEVETNEVISFHVRETGEMRKEYFGRWIGVVRPKLAWHTEPIS